ncbi:tyrosine-type recombinase/integrase, partial [Bacillus cabrialesii]
KTKKAAKETEAEMLFFKDSGSRLTFKEVAESYYVWYKARRKISSVNVIKNILFNHLIKEFGNMKVESVIPKNVMMYQN